MDILTAIGLALPAGLNAYIPLLGLAVAERLDVVALPEPWSQLGEWWAIALIAVLLAVEIAADKIPAVDHVNDVIQTVVRPAAGAIVAVAASGQAGQNYPLVMVALGILLAGGVHAIKASSRPLINATTGGAGAPVVSAAEDGIALSATAIALLVPVLVGAVIIGAVGSGWWVYRRRRTIPTR
ncbi:MAG TPA: DUF4126 domain-containing protein [Coriobacteriia bacterium]|nr:DUF4126 domain-containing protein [Coriobacteriia bacterium]